MTERRTVLAREGLSRGWAAPLSPSVVPSFRPSVNEIPRPRSFVAELERTGQLKRVRVEVDPIYEVAGSPAAGPRERSAVIFERVKGAQFPLVLNLSAR